MAERYFVEWTANTGESCRLSLDDSLWAYAAEELPGFSRSVVVREHQTDGEDIFGVFRSCRLTVNLVDEGGNGIENFITGDALRWKATLTVDSVTKFEGFYVPDDLQQQVIFNPNQLTLTFTDGLGLLKNFTLADTDLNLDVDKYSLLEIINACLKKTGLTLGLRVFGNIYANGLMTQRYTSATADPFFQAEQKIKSYILPNSDDTNWENCYTVIEKILRDWNATIYQEDGYWYIVRIPELQAGSPDGTQYDSDLYNPSAITTDLQDVLVGDDQSIVPVNRSQIKSLVRPASAITNTYNYRVIRLLLNRNFITLGSLISSVVDGENTIETYNLAVWENVGGCDAVIVVVRNTITEKEVERYVKFSWAASQQNGIYSNEFDVNEGDKFNFRYDLRAESDSNFSSTQTVGLWMLGDSTDTYVMVANTLLDRDRLWKDPAGEGLPVGASYVNPSRTIGAIYPGSTDIRENTTFDVTNNNSLPQERFPEDGKMRIGIFGFNNTGGRLADRDSIISNIQFGYFFYVSNTIRVKGETHKVTQTTDLNSLFEREIFTSDSPKGNAAGTLFVGINKTESWGSNNYPFAKQSILDEMLIRGVARYKLEGDFRGLLSMNKVLSPDFFTCRRFFMNRLVVDYGTGVCNLFADEVSGPDDLTYNDFTYTFNYIYE